MTTLRQWWRIRRPEWMSGLLFWIARAVGSSLRTEEEGYAAAKALPGGKILLTWHGRTIVPGQFFRNEGFWVIISNSRDGEIQNRILGRMGFHVIRGSTGRGGERALIESIRCLKAGNTMAITPDGPRGPSGVVQGGVMRMAQKSGAALIPVGISAKPRWLAKSWDKHMVPYPFARCVILFGDPMYVPKDADEEILEKIRLELQSKMHEMEMKAEARVHGRVEQR